MSNINECDVYDLGNDRIGFYCDVNEKTVSVLVKMLMEKADQLTTAAAKKIGTQSKNENEKTKSRPDLFLYVRSKGGSVSCSMAAYDHIKSLAKRVRVVTVAEGLVASCSSIVFLAGERRLATRHSVFLFHQLSTTFEGTYTNLKYEMKECKLLMKMMSRVMVKSTKMSKRKVADLLKRELMLTSKQCRRMGVFRSYL